MSAKPTFEISLRNVQERMEDGVKEARRLSRKAMLAYTGMWGMTYDVAKSVTTDSQKWMDKAEKRGEEIEKEFLAEFNKVEKQATDEFKKWYGKVEGQVEKVTKEVSERADGLVKSVRTLDLNRNGKADMAEATDAAKEIKISAAKVVDKVETKVEAAKKDAVKAAEKIVAEANAAVEKTTDLAKSVFDEVWQGYDEMGAKDIVTGLSTMDMDKLAKVREHEAAHKNRVTILREIDTRMQELVA